MDKNRLKKLIIPLIFEQILAISVGFADTFMVAKVGEAAVSGVALVDSINLLVIQVMAAFASGGIVVTSQYIGDDNPRMVKSACRNLEILICAFAVIVMSIFLLFKQGILGTLFGRIEADVMQASLTYLTFTAISFVFWGSYTAGAAILRSHENTSTSMKVSFLMNGLNVALNAVFVFGFHMGVLGVALATLISRAVAGICMKFIVGNYMAKRYNNRLVDNNATIVLKETFISWDMIKRILAMGIPSGIENGMFHAGKLALTSVIATLGTSAIAANAIAYQIIEFPNIFGNAMGLALVVIIGQDIGAARKETALEDTKYMIKLTYIGDWICKIALLILAPFVVNIFGLTPEAKQIAVLVLRCFSIAALPIWPLSFTMPSALRGAGDVKYSMIASIISMWVGRVITSYILIVFFNLGILGVWIGMFVDWYGRGLSYLFRFRSRRWLDKKAIQ